MVVEPTEEVPVFKGLPDEDTKLRARIDELQEIFIDRFGRKPDIVARVPGRVNLIGEHVDYCGYSVCPMAIEQDILIAASVGADHRPFLEIINIQNDSYPGKIVPSDNFEISLAKDGWVAYVLCGIKGVMSVMNSSRRPVKMQMAVSGRVPPGSGLSSSSALVCASLLTTAWFNKVQMGKTQMAELSASCERFVGLEGGGMDQAIAFLANKGCAKHIQFNPLRTKDVKMPEKAVFVIAHSLVTKKKAETSEYNTRVMECRLASQIIAKKRELDWRKIRKVSDVQDALCYTFQDMLNAINECLRDGIYTKKDVCEELGVSEEELHAVSFTQSAQSMNEFKLKNRVTHVITEAHRVEWWMKESTIEGLGNLMTASHNSMARDYDASDPSCDRLVETAMNAGAEGSRITGAGWGGCVVSLVKQKNVENFLKEVAQNFYKDYEGDINEVLFPTEPQQGASIFVLL